MELSDGTENWEMETVDHASLKNVVMLNRRDLEFWVDFGCIFTRFSFGSLFR